MNPTPIFSPLRIANPSRLLLVAAGHVGNCIFCTPAIHWLRRALPHATIDVVVLNQACAAVFAGNDAISSVLVVRWRWQMTKLAGHYDHVVCLHPKSIALLAQVTVPMSVIPPFSSDQHHAEQILTFARALAGGAVDNEDRRYRITPVSTAASRLVGQARPLIGIHLGCGRTAIHGWKFFYRKRDAHPKLWPIEHYAELAKQLRNMFPDAQFVLTGTRNERFLARRFSNIISDAIDLTGRTSVVELAGLIEQMDLFITHDCGVMHVAASTSTPLVALFGPTSPALTGPWPLAAHHRILQAERMADITPQMAARAATDLLQSSSVANKAAPALDVVPVPNHWIAITVLWLQQHDVFNSGYVAALSAGLS
ncbi:MAG: glycosyltransferase family 9 protein [Spongiibacteraceae bacterium]